MRSASFRSSAEIFISIFHRTSRTCSIRARKRAGRLALRIEMEVQRHIDLEYVWSFHSEIDARHSRLIVLACFPAGCIACRTCVTRYRKGPVTR